VTTTHISFDDLPTAVLTAIERHTGPVIKTEPVSHGLNSEIAVRLFTDSGSCFVKGLRTDHRRVWTQYREAEVNPFLHGISPALLWRVQDAGWVLLGFELLDGHQADYSPGSPDLPKVADALRRLGDTPCPEVELRHAEQRLEKYVPRSADIRFFAGSSLLHTDLNNANVLVDEKARFVDWAWATRGAPWLDAGYWIIWLIAAGGHTVESAEGWAGRVPAWQTAPASGVASFAQANANVWEEIAGADPDPWTSRLLRASRQWAGYRRAR
jgi:hypothetical protein